jgi:hypothetical protein
MFGTIPAPSRTPEKLWKKMAMRCLSFTLPAQAERPWRC